MKIEIETSSYNDHRYGKPYIAKVDFAIDPQGSPIWGDWIGQAGYAGILQIEAAAGDVLMKGKKDNRNPRNSAPEYGFVELDGTVTWGLGKAEAYKKWDAVEAGECPLPENPLASFTNDQLLQELSLRGIKV